MTWLSILQAGAKAFFASDWIGVLKAVLSLAALIAEVVRDKQLMDAGRKAEIAVQLAAIAKRVEVTEEIRAAVASLTDAEIDDELGKTDPL